jgi:isopenicillin N synthase-like dioxygenase
MLWISRSRREAAMSDDAVPIIDVGPFLAGDPQSRISTPRAVARACEEIGFFTIIGHGVDPAVIAAATSATRQFFELPPAEKVSARSADAAISRGYRGIGNEGLAGTRANETPPDLKEVFHLGPPDFPHDAYHCAAEAQPHFIDNVWPQSPAAFRPAATAYYRATEKLAADLMRIFALALDLPETFFADKIDRHISALRIINYPEQAVAPLPGQLRAGAHSDYGTLTILLGENQPGSLEVYTRSERWMPVHIPPDSFVINIGDLMMRWTNDRWISTLHRVVNPPEAEAARARRLSLVFFHHPNYDAEVACIPTCADAANPPRYPAVKAGPYRRDKYAQAARVKPAAA